MNFWKRHIGDYVRSASHLSLLEHGVLVRLLDCYYVHESGIPKEKAPRLIGARTKEELKALETVLSEFFVLVDSTWIQDRCEREISAASAKAAANKKNGTRGGRPKGSTAKQTPATTKVGSDDEPTNNPDGFGSKPMIGVDGFESKPTENLSQTPDSRLHAPGHSDTSLRSVSGGKPPPPEIKTKENFWHAGKSLLAQAGMPAAQCGTFIGKLVKHYGQGIAQQAIHAAVFERPADPASYLRATCQRMTGERLASRGARPSSNDFEPGSLPVFVDPFEEIFA